MLSKIRFYWSGAAMILRLVKKLAKLVEKLEAGAAGAHAEIQAGHGQLDAITQEYQDNFDLATQRYRQQTDAVTNNIGRLHEARIKGVALAKAIRWLLGDEPKKGSDGDGSGNLERREDADGNREAGAGGGEPNVR